jgi:hypothetical protein
MSRGNRGPAVWDDQVSDEPDEFLKRLAAGQRRINFLPSVLTSCAAHLFNTRKSHKHCDLSHIFSGGAAVHRTTSHRER